MLKKMFSLMLSTVIMLCAMGSFFTVAAEEVSDEETSGIVLTDFVYNDQMSVFDLIKIKRSLMANETTYTMEDYEYLRDNLLRLRVGDIKYAKGVVLEFDTDGYPLFGYKDPSVLDCKIVNAGRVIDIPQHTLQREGASQGGWMYDGKNYIQGEEFTVPEGVDKIVFTPYWFIYHTMTFYAGDYDDVVEYPSVTLQGTEGVGMELPVSTRFTRPGYNLIGWTCSYDGKDYGPGIRYVVPDADVTFTAIWEQASVTVQISAGNGVTTDKIIETAFVGDDYVLPECTFTNGEKTFAGWRYNGIVYQPGDSFKVPALLSGEKVFITAKWV